MTRTVNETIHSYVTDMLALENQIGTALKGQVKDHQKDHPKFATMLEDIRGMAERHEKSLKSLEETHDAGAKHDIADFFKRTATSVAGAGAAAIDMMRSEKLPKDLRDDYTALSLGTIGYTMLFTTARALGDSSVATVAERHLKDYAGVVMRLSDIIPSTVVDVLRADGQAVDASVLTEINETVERAWRQQS